MNTKEKIIKHIYDFFSIIGNLFTFYFITIGILVLYAFQLESGPQEMLSLTMMYQFYVALLSVYILLKVSRCIFLKHENCFKTILYSVIGFIYLGSVATDPDKIMIGFLTCFLMKMLISAFVRIKRYSLECIGYKTEKHLTSE